MRVFITGLTGSLGTSLAKLHHNRGDQVWGCARNEEKAVRWLRDNPRLATFYACDALNLSDPTTDIGRLLSSMDRLYHCAAMKHIDLCEKNICEAYFQNICLTGLVSTACITARVPMVFISSDKACLPQGVYGATKLLAERTVLNDGGSVVRLGNLAGSSGSVFQIWEEAARKAYPVRVTDPDMTRYFISIQQATEFVVDQHIPGRVVIPHPLKSICMGTLAKAYSQNPEITGSRPGETIDQWLVAPGEKVRFDGSRLILGEGDPCFKGMCSLAAPRWEAAELIASIGH